MAEYIGVPIDTDPQDILQEAYEFLQAQIPGWSPSSGHLDVWLLMALSSVAAESRDVASLIPKSIFRYFGAYLVGLPPIDETPASAITSWTMINNAGYTIPAGTQVSIPKAGDLPVAFATQQDYVVPPGTTVLGGITVVALTAGAIGSGLGAPAAVVTLEDPLDFVLSIAQTTVSIGGVDAETDDAYLARLTGQLQLLAPRPILPNDFAVFARNITNVFRAVAIDGYNPFHNLLTANESSAETDATGWTNVTNTTIAQSGAQFADGIKSISMTAIAAADMAMHNAASKTVTPGETITALASVRAAVTIRSTKVGIEWRDAGDALLSTVYGAAANDSAGAFVNYTATAVAPAGAAKCRVVVFVTAPALGEVHYADKMSLRRGATTDWIIGGTPDTGNARMIAIAAQDTAGAPVDGPTKAAIQADLQARREVNFVVNVVDQNTIEIDVTYQVKALAGYDLATLVTAINAAITGYLSPSVWGSLQSDPRAWTDVTSVRYLEIAAVINNVTGVDYITTTAGVYDLTIGVHGGALARLDVPLGGVAPVPHANTLTGTAL